MFIALVRLEKSRSTSENRNVELRYDLVLVRRGRWPKLTRRILYTYSAVMQDGEPDTAFPWLRSPRPMDIEQKFYTNFVVTMAHLHVCIRWQ